MIRSFGRHLTYANVTATVAVFLALGGASYAAFRLPRNSVGTRQIRRNAVTGAKVKRGTLSAAALSDSARASLAGSGAAGAAGAQGPAGPAGQTGPQGPTGPQGANGDPGSPATDAATLEGLTANQITRSGVGGGIVNASTSPSGGDLMVFFAPKAGNEVLNAGFQCVSFHGTANATSKWTLQLLVDGQKVANPGVVTLTQSTLGTLTDSATIPALATVASGHHPVTYTATRNSGDGSLDCSITVTGIYTRFNDDGT